MTSPRQILANRKNAARSTGPRTEQGKARSSQNALRHGLARPFGEEATDLRNIEKLAVVIAREDKGVARRIARAVAKAELELVHIRKIRAETWGLIGQTIEGGIAGNIADAIKTAGSMDRYEKRAISRKKKIVRKALVVE